MRCKPALTLRRSVSLIQRSLPRVSVMSARSGGLQKASQRRGVTPLVLFWNFSGKMSWKGPKTSCFRISATWEGGGGGVTVMKASANAAGGALTGGPITNKRQQLPACHKGSPNCRFGCSPEWIFATPLTHLEAITARYAMRTCTRAAGGAGEVACSSGRNASTPAVPSPVQSKTHAC